jgi:hypothetical protein
MMSSGEFPDPPALDEDGRSRLRRERIARRPGWYSPWAHLATTVGLGAGLATLALSRIDHVHPAELAAVPLTLLFANAVEWHAHKGLLHKRVRGLEAFYDRHTPVHHRVFVEHDMAIRSPWELGFVLIPWYGILGIFSLTLPIALALTALGAPNIAGLFVATSMLYIVAYECLHLAYHLPPDGLVGRRRLIAWLRRHHGLHHRYEMMQKWNFNVTLPLWDWIRGTLRRDAAK